MGTIAGCEVTTNGIGTPSSWILPPDSSFRREADRPKPFRPDDFEENFDAHTILYDCFRLQEGQVMMIAPPLAKFGGVLDSLVIESLPSGSRCQFTTRHQFRQCRVTVNVRESDSALYVRSAAGEAVIDVRPNGCEAFRGRRVLFTLSKDNHPKWICDWMRFHRDVHSADAVLLYDNGSTSYTVEALLEAMRKVRGFKAISVVEWPYKYGPQGINGWHWDSNFCQDGALEDARWRYLASADAVLNIDIDELVLSDHGDAFERAARSSRSYVQFSGRWVIASDEGPFSQSVRGETGSNVARHKESSSQLLPHWRWGKLRPQDKNLCPKKWAVVPERCPASAQWSVHVILGVRGQKLALGDTSYRHFRQINTNWKYRRSDAGTVECQRTKRDTTLLEAFGRVCWDA